MKIFNKYKNKYKIIKKNYIKLSEENNILNHEINKINKKIDFLKKEFEYDVEKLLIENNLLRKKLKNIT